MPKLALFIEIWPSQVCNLTEPSGRAADSIDFSMYIPPLIYIARLVHLIVPIYRHKISCLNSHYSSRYDHNKFITWQSNMAESLTASIFHAHPTPGLYSQISTSHRAGIQAQNIIPKLVIFIEIWSPQVCNLTAQSGRAADSIDFPCTCHPRLIYPDQYISSCRYTATKYRPQTRNIHRDMVITSL